MKPKSSFLKRELEDDALIEEMNILGNEGWELVSSIDHAVGGSTTSIVLIFKRQIGIK